MKDSFEQLPDLTLNQLPQLLQDAAARASWETLMPVQARAIPYLLAKRNMMIQARTGSGKTGAYLLPMLERLDSKKNHCQALILVPTRELARQVSQEAETLCGKSGFRTVAVYGGVGYGPQIDAFRKGAHIVVGTPGRVLDHLLRETLSLKKLDMIIFDEADRMLSMGFYPDMKSCRTTSPLMSFMAVCFRQHSRRMCLPLPKNLFTNRISYPLAKTRFTSQIRIMFFTRFPEWIKTAVWFVS